MASQHPPIDVVEREQMGVAKVFDRLVQQFPEVAPTTIRAVVDDAHTGMTGRIRDFVPIFVERRSRDRLRTMRQDPFAA